MTRTFGLSVAFYLFLFSGLLAIGLGGIWGADQSPGGRTLEKATFAGGCFWCMEHPFDALTGVVSVTSGYTGGHKKDPTYEEVSAGGTGHAESVQIVYDPSKISYEKLLQVYWHNIDPTVEERQFCDSGHQYRSAIFYQNETQRQLALKSRNALEKDKPFKDPVVTEITQATEFYPAEEYHQHYYKKNPIRYKYYRSRCGRDDRLKELWGKDARFLRKMLDNGMDYDHYYGVLSSGSKRPLLGTKSAINS